MKLLLPCLFFWLAGCEIVAQEDLDKKWCTMRADCHCAGCDDRLIVGE